MATVSAGSSQIPFPFRVGEKLTFSVEYGPIKAGHATLEVRDTVDVDGVRCWHFVSEARSNPWFSIFFKVEDHIDSFASIDSLHSVRFEKHLREGHYSADECVHFDQGTQEAFYPNDSVTVEMPYGSRDILASLYYARTADLKVGQSLLFDNHTDKKNYPIEIQVIRQETIDTSVGTFDCLVIEPMLQSVGIFKHEGKLTVWVTNDPWKIPVLMKSKVLIGSIQVIIKEIQLSG